MDKLIKKFFVCFNEDLQKIIYNIELQIKTDKCYISGAEMTLKRIEDENLSDSEYREKYFGTIKSMDIRSNKLMIERCELKIAQNENKLSLYNNMMKILSIL
jgi:hypothetical protein